MRHQRIIHSFFYLRFLQGMQYEAITYDMNFYQEGRPFLPSQNVAMAVVNLKCLTNANSNGIFVCNSWNFAKMVVFVLKLDKGSLFQIVTLALLVQTLQRSRLCVECLHLIAICGQTRAKLVYQVLNSECFKEGLQKIIVGAGSPR